MISLMLCAFCTVAALASSDVSQDRRISLTELAKRERIGVSTCWRWAGKGVRGVRLSTFNIGAKRFTTEAAWIQFREDSTAAAQRGWDKANPTREPSSRVRNAAIDRAERELEDEGA
jgi:hypothetical protein